MSPVPIPGDAELLFIESASTGTVHIGVRYRSWHTVDAPVREVISGGAAFVEMAVRPTIVRCGQRTFPQFEDRHSRTDEFDDALLCRGCYLTLHPDDQCRAFEAKQMGAEDPQ